MKKLLQFINSVINFILNNLTYLPDFRDNYYKKTGEPLFIKASNCTDKPLGLVLFGYEAYMSHKNFGCEQGIQIESTDVVSYKELLEQSAKKPFKTTLVRVKSTNASQVLQNMVFTRFDENFETLKKDVIVQNYFSANQFQSGIVDMPIEIYIDAYSYLKTTILPHTTVYYTFYPLVKKTFWQKVTKFSTIAYRIFLNLLHIVFAVVVISYLIKKIFLI